MIRPRRTSFIRFRLVLVGLALVGLLIGVGALVAGGPSRASAASHDPGGNESCDLVGEGHATGGVLASLGGEAFPGRLITVTIPGRSAAAPSAVHVYEDCQAAPNAVVTALAATSTSRRFVVRYESTRPFGVRDVEVGIRVDGVGAFDIDYNAPKSASAVSVAPTRRSSFWGSTPGLVVASLAAALLVAIGLVALLSGALRRNDLRRRVGEFTTNMSDATESPGGRTHTNRNPLPRLEGMLERMSWWPRFKANVEIAQFPRSAAELVAITASATVGIALIAGVAVGGWLSLMILPFGPLTLHLVVQHRMSRRRELFCDQLGPHLQELASALRAGHGLVAGLTAMVRAANEPSKAEWARVVADEQLGMALDDALRSLAVRMNCADVEQVALVAALHSRTGGNMAEVLDRIAEGVRERAELRRELGALTGQARLSRWVVTGVPPAIMALVAVIDPAYLRPLIDTRTGHVMLAIAALLLVSGSLIMKALTRIEV